MAAFTVNLAFPELKINKVDETDRAITVFAETQEMGVKCHVCGQWTDRFHGYDDARYVQHLPVMGRMLTICYSPRRYLCIACNICDVTTTATPSWHYVKSSFTYEFEIHVLVALINSTVSDVAIKNGLTEKEVQGIVDRHLAGCVDWGSLDSLSVLGIDEITMRKGYSNYITVITSRKDGKTYLLALIKGRKKKVIKRFLKSIPSRLKKTVIAICVDMYKGYINAAKEVFKKAAIIVDRYHVAKLYRASLDKFRQTILAELKRTLSASEYEAIKNVTHILRRGKEYLSKEDKEKVEAIFSHSFPLSEAYRLSVALTHIFNTHLTVEAALEQFSDWIAAVRKTKLQCFNKFIKTLNTFKQEIANYFIERQTSGFVEGLNNKIKVLKRRCYGIFNLKHMFQRLHLDISGYRLYASNIGV